MLNTDDMDVQIELEAASVEVLIEFLKRNKKQIDDGMPVVFFTGGEVLAEDEEYEYFGAVVKCGEDQEDITDYDLIERKKQAWDD